jgi:phosphohistidine phosphatase
MRLYFVRHGRAEDRLEWNPADDHLRPLTDIGKYRMERAANRMIDLGVAPDVILTSPLTRARQTADIVGEALDCEVVEIYELADLSVDVLSHLLDRYAFAESLMLVGHEPDFSMTIDMICGGGNVVVKKGSLIRVDLFSTFPPRGSLVWSIPPKILVL